ncbi:hypothetical protein EJ05DRAFT_500974 [Pseudovirgaria hyperparasitica]|uniref:Arb2 domain-containing protein n=1 Tax=Pseudovirgaria hyperparasitica TaxID=470096 RepID=A0A6A6W787_9PEZI|nr:uncharacterized protein EJ05DRAFT_500974 [Pseudovirgaria hyperparasitica]KAF2757437.1 hypothetical protein EJ05DRAFT_500974 [Pseudovirgaria hyperparasitica]
MFRRLEDGLVKDHPDPHWPDDMNKLGCFITEDGLLRRKDKPDQRFDYWVTNHERYNEVHREAMQKCIRREIDSRMAQLGIEKLYMPQLIYEEPRDEPHIPIYAPPVEILRARKRVIILINDDFQDLGVLAYRHLYEQGGFEHGSCVSTVKDLIARSPPLGVDGDVNPETAAQSRGAPALIVLNPGQLRYSHKYNCAMTRISWLAMPRKSIAHPATAFDGDENTVPGHRTIEDHIKTVFEQVVGDTRFVSPEAEVYVIAVSEGARATLDILDENWPKYSQRLTGLALMDPPGNYKVWDVNFRSFLKYRTRAWIKSERSSNTLLETHFTALPDNFKVYDIANADQEHYPPEENRSGVPLVKHETNWLENVTQGVSRQQIKEIIGFNDTKAYLDHVKNIGAESVLTSAGNSMINLPKAAASAQSSTSGHASKIVQSATAETGANAKNLESRIDQLVKDSFSQALYPTFSGGDPVIAEMLFPQVKGSVLDFFEEIAQDPTAYRNPEFALTPRTAAAEIADAVDALDLMDPDEAGRLYDGDTPLQLDGATSEVQKVPFAGTMVDSQLLNKAGLSDVSRERSTSVTLVNTDCVEQCHEQESEAKVGKLGECKGGDDKSGQDLRKDSGA